MTKTIDEVFNDTSLLNIYQKLESIATQLDSEKNPLVIELLNVMDELENYISRFKVSFSEIKRMQDTEAEKVRLMQNEIDDLKKHISKDDLKMRRENCAKRYRTVWDKLSDESKEYLVLASYLLSLSQVVRYDASPAIIEMCCAFEQELRDKIFSDFITEEANAKTSDYDFDGSPLCDAILSLRRNGHFYLSMINMINFLAVVDSRLSSDSANGKLKRKLEQSKWKTNELADPSFISQGKDYTINYRDTAAHPNIMSKEDAETCNTMTKDLLCHFLMCKQ